MREAVHLPLREVGGDMLLEIPPARRGEVDGRRQQLLGRAEPVHDGGRLLRLVVDALRDVFDVLVEPGDGLPFSAVLWLPEGDP